MKIKVAVVALMTLMGVVAVPPGAEAEGRCPPGMYPISSPGVLGCAPIPQVPQEESSPAFRWESRWGAIASDASGTMIHGLSREQPTRDAAVQRALQRCQEAGGQACSLRFTYSNSCVFVAAPYVDGEPAAGTPSAASGPQDGKAEALALSDCKLANGVGCRIDYAACSHPVLVAQ